MLNRTRQTFITSDTQHDTGRLVYNRRNAYYLVVGFDKLYDTSVLLEDKWILSHEPVLIERNSCFVNLYGHTHDHVIQEDYFCHDQENYARDVRSGIVPEMRWQERKVNLENYKNVCLYHLHWIAKWKGDDLYVNKKLFMW